MRPLLSLLLLGLLACSNTMQGTVDGERVGRANESIYQLVSYEVPLVGTLTGVGLAVTGARDACAGLEALDNVSNDCNDRCDELLDIASDHLPSDEIWTLWIWLISDDAVEGHYLHSDQSDFDGFGASIDKSDVSALRDYEACIDLCSDGDPIPTTSENSTGGVIELTAYEPHERLEGEYSIEFGADVVEGRFSASECEIFEIF
jgi:hypothetical protein